MPYVLRVSLDAGTPACRNGVFKTNFPIDGGQFDRHRFAERRCVQRIERTLTLTRVHPLACHRLPINFSSPIQIDLPISHAGAFVYWVEYDADQPNERVKGREGYFNIDPILRVKKRQSILSPPTPGGALTSCHPTNLVDEPPPSADELPPSADELPPSADELPPSAVPSSISERPQAGPPSRSAACQRTARYPPPEPQAQKR